MIIFPDVENEERAEHADESDAPVPFYREPEANLVDADEAERHAGHETGWKHGEQVICPLLAIVQVDCRSPEGEYGQGLVRPAEITPNLVEAVRIRHIVPI